MTKTKQQAETEQDYEALNAVKYWPEIEANHEALCQYEDFYQDLDFYQYESSN